MQDKLIINCSQYQQDPYKGRWYWSVRPALESYDVGGIVATEDEAKEAIANWKTLGAEAIRRAWVEEQLQDAEKYALLAVQSYARAAEVDPSAMPDQPVGYAAGYQAGIEAGKAALRALISQAMEAA